MLLAAAVLPAQMLLLLLLLAQDRLLAPLPLSCQALSRHLPAAALQSACPAVVDKWDNATCHVKPEQMQALATQALQQPASRLCVCFPTVAYLVL
jgi:hypothetical protein